MTRRSIIPAFLVVAQPAEPAEDLAADAARAFNLDRMIGHGGDAKLFLCEASPTTETDDDGAYPHTLEGLTCDGQGLLDVIVGMRRDIGPLVTAATRAQCVLSERRVDGEHNDYEVVEADDALSAALAPFLDPADTPAAPDRDALLATVLRTGATLRQIQMHAAPWYDKGTRQGYAERVGLPTSSSRAAIERAAADQFDAALVEATDAAPQG